MIAGFQAEIVSEHAYRPVAPHHSLYLPVRLGRNRPAMLLADQIPAQNLWGQILTYSVMSNHFHILLQVSQRQEVSDALLIERLAAIYPRQRVAEVASELAGLRKAGEHEAAERLKGCFTYRMYDIV